MCDQYEWSKVKFLAPSLGCLGLEMPAEGGRQLGVGVCTGVCLHVCVCRCARLCVCVCADVYVCALVHVFVYMHVCV